MENIFYSFKNGEFPVPGSRVFIRLTEEAIQEQDCPEAYVVSVETWQDGHLHFIEAAGEGYAEFCPKYIKDWCYLSDLMKLH